MAEKLNATFFAFQKREGGGALIWTSIAYVVAFIALYAVIIGIGWVALDGASFMTWYNEVIAAQARGETYSEAPPNGAAFLLIIPLVLVFVILQFVLLAAYESACIRWMLRGERSGALQLHFGHDMWRVYGTYWFWFFYTLISGVIFFVVVTAVTMAAASAGEYGGWIAFAAIVLALFAWLYTTVRLSPASATSIGIGEFAPFKAWSVSSGRFWALFGAYFLLFVIYLIVATIVGAIVLGSYYSQLFGGLDWTLAQTDPDAFMRAYEQASLEASTAMFASPTSTAIYIGGQLVSFTVALVFYVLWYGVETRAVQAALEESKIERAAPQA